MGRKKTSLKHCYLHGIVTCPYFLGPENGVHFLRRFSFPCGIGCIFVALFVKSSFGHVWSMYRSSPFRSTLNTSYIAGLDMCEVCTEAVHSVALWTLVTSQVWTCVKVCTEAVHSVALSTRVTSQVWTCVKYVPKQSIPFRSTLNTSYITGLDMCEVCTEAVHSVALWTRVTPQVWTCVKYVPKQSIL